MQFTLKTTIKTPAKDIYEAWLSSKGHTLMTGGEAEASDSEGAAFTAWDGYIWGSNVALEPFTRIVQSWRTSQFEPHEEDSQIEVILNEVNGSTEVTLVHTNVPESGEHYKKGWEDHYFKPMQEYFEEG